jgi:periplasmic protein TonB
MIPNNRKSLGAGLVLSLLLSGVAFAKTQSDAQPAPRTINISAAVLAANILKRVPPVYPSDAKAAGIQGTVVLRVIVSVEGEVTSATAVAGNPKLQPSAIDAVKQWRYKPYLLNGQPVEVESTVNVVYSLGIPNSGPGTPPPPPAN